MLSHPKTSQVKTERPRSPSTTSDSVGSSAPPAKKPRTISAEGSRGTRTLPLTFCEKPPSSMSETHSQVQYSYRDQASLAGGEQADEELIDAEGNSMDNVDDAKFGSDYLKLDEVVKLEYGKELEMSATIHLGYLFYRSHRLRKLYFDAEELHNKYSEMKELRRSLKKALAKGDAESAANLIYMCLEKLPLLEYQVPLSGTINKVIGDHSQNKDMVKMPLSNGGFEKPDPSRQGPRPRLQQLNRNGILNVARYLKNSLANVKLQEFLKAQGDAVKALAQRRLILPNVDNTTMEILGNWLYQCRLVYENAEQLCQTITLAEDLGIQGLADECIGKLANATQGIINQAKTAGISFRDLFSQTENAIEDLADSSHPLADGTVVRTVFMFVFKEKTSTRILKDLVVRTITENPDSTLLKSIVGEMSRSLTEQCMVALAEKLEPKSCGSSLADEKRNHHKISESTNGTLDFVDDRDERMHDASEHQTTIDSQVPEEPRRQSNEDVES